ncbi:MAG: hypothetical protein A3B89_01205 [Candidatus Buchananbacteria bacterium RIFCSPHIGHO2_02_FULL_40_13]|uniref:DNA 3'-5' helicase n=1 Tax=Candidatus Buchananbacteria bacterium RIFCSPLOWO2_01_FULL_39_33 TaxID=1797543 RepID=A0A1G1YN64_9BACT|nr:MAG: hypothetical protein A2820_03360 [Candidatus Buchananbacteria bacterium RIFCSPHIGHO2_01_FULL_40_35]OGY50108.1 MAG: hypothetical protein A3B89_01205 [Candidatus Buchananbacteria bacterium RIFCSPHIGHO2_02_FULL_40_13]OGY53090.1 MAG: hypothetical protein A3A02_00020 [Candidatus Buchananbacteria bacterium RIFCSPLOWO2_01_FULL_39_33]
MDEYILKNQEPNYGFKINYRAELNEEQYQVVTQGDGPCLVLAGAGSGKTRTLVYRVAYLLEKGANPNSILLVTFTNKAAREMTGRLELLLKDQVKGLWSGTFHHIGNRLLRTYGQAIGLNPNFNILDNEDSKSLIKACRQSVSLPNDKYFPKADLIHKIISLSVNSKNNISDLINRRFSQIDENYIPLIEKIGNLYQARKKQANALDFDDLLSEWNRLLLESESVREKLAKQFKYILVDEYQDTNYIQGEIINHLAGDDQNVLVVGDDSQSIYSFRGAVVENILDFPKNFSQTKTFKLEINYRSTPEILGLANESIRHNRHKFDKKLRTHKKSGERPALVALDSVDSQADFICQRILDLQKEQRINLNEIAVLFRAHFQSLELELAMNKRNIPYVMRGGLRFFEQAHIKDVVAYLRILANHLDEVSWVRILQLQTGIGPATVDLIWQNIRQVGSLKQILEKSFNLPLKAAGGWTEARNILLKLYSLEPSGLSALIETILTFGYQKMVRNNFENSEDRLADLEQLAIFADRYDSLDKFLVDTALGENFKGSKLVENKESILEAVILSTIHQAKGLEWKAVFIISLLDGQFPNAKAFDNYQDLEEERRMFYVASTRAQDQLYLTYPIFSSYTGQINQVSQFVKELPKNVYEKWKVKDELISEDDVVYVDEDSPFNLDDVSANFWKRFKKRRN